MNIDIYIYINYYIFFRMNLSIAQLIITLVSYVIVGLDSKTFCWNMMFFDSLQSKSQGVRVKITMWGIQVRGAGPWTALGKRFHVPHRANVKSEVMMTKSGLGFAGLCESHGVRQVCCASAVVEEGAAWCVARVQCVSQITSVGNQLSNGWFGCGLSTPVEGWCFLVYLEFAGIP